MFIFSYHFLEIKNLFVNKPQKRLALNLVFLETVKMQSRNLF